MNKPRRCLRCGCSRRFHTDDGCLGHLKCKTGIAESRYFVERRSEKAKTLADYELKRTDELA